MLSCPPKILSKKHGFDLRSIYDRLKDFRIFTNPALWQVYFRKILYGFSALVVNSVVGWHYNCPNNLMHSQI